jgi:hypothetical protein
MRLCSLYKDLIRYRRLARASPCGTPVTQKRFDKRFSLTPA